MAILRPTPIAALARRLFDELAEKQAVFDLPARRFVRGIPGADLSMRLGGRDVAIPFGPAAGPHTQLAQNLVLSWLAGGRVMELKTVQSDDAIRVPRPCIDMRDVGLNCEFSQELTVSESLLEYVKGALLVAMLAESDRAKIPAGFRATAYDASVGYDLVGIQSPKVRDYLSSLQNISPLVARLREELPADLRPLADVPMPRSLVESVTLSTFHGCPPHEIEAIVRHLLEAHGLSVVIKLNPTLLGEQTLNHLLHEVLGFTDLVVPQRAFHFDPVFDDVVGMVTRLRGRARELGLGLGVKLTNTLVVENRRGVFPESVRDAYLSGPPLHVLAVELVRRLRAALPWVPLSFSAGVDAHNVADLLALGLAPVTVCTDWLKTGGYSRGVRYAEALAQHLTHLGCKTREALILRAFGHEAESLAAASPTTEEASRVLAGLGERGDPRGLVPDDVLARWLHEATLRNTVTYADRVLADPRYRRDHHEKTPKKVGHTLATFDCLSCNKCIAVCPNDALFAYVAPQMEVPVTAALAGPKGPVVRRSGALRIDERHQIASFADHCNDCGNCDTFCPEDGGPHRAKPRFFSSLKAFRADPGADAVHVLPTEAGYVAHGRHDGREVILETVGSRAHFCGAGFALRFDWRDPEGTLKGELDVEVDLTEARVLHVLATSVFSPREINWMTAPWRPYG
jgi:putative selenate reductase